MTRLTVIKSWTNSLRSTRSCPPINTRCNSRHSNSKLHNHSNSSIKPREARRLIVEQVKILGVRATLSESTVREDWVIRRIKTRDNRAKLNEVGVVKVCLARKVKTWEVRATLSEAPIREATRGLLGQGWRKTSSKRNKIIENRCLKVYIKRIH